MRKKKQARIVIISYRPMDVPSESKFIFNFETYNLAKEANEQFKKLFMTLGYEVHKQLTPSSCEELNHVLPYFGNNSYDLWLEFD